MGERLMKNELLLKDPLEWALSIPAKNMAIDPGVCDSRVPELPTFEGWEMRLSKCGLNKWTVKAWQPRRRLVVVEHLTPEQVEAFNPNTTTWNVTRK